MSEHFYLARQVILNNDETIMGYELLYRDSTQKAHIQNPRHATAALLVNVLNQAGLNNVVGENLAFINVDDSFLRHNFIESIPPKTFVFELTATTSLDERLVERVQNLNNARYVFSLDLDSYEKIDVVKTLAPYLSFLKIDTSGFNVEHLKALKEALSEYPLIYIASKVEDEETFKSYQKEEFDAYQGYFFAQPHIIQDKKLDANQLVLFKLCDTIQSGASTADIVKAFEQSPAMTLQLLQFINSGAFHFRDRISSINQVITLLGRNSLIQWLMLLLYSKNFSSKVKYQNPLILMVRQRTEIMVNLLKLIKKDASTSEQGEAYFVGILSLMDTLLHVPLDDVLREFYVEKSISDAIYYQSGFLGELYTVVLAVEQFDTHVLDSFLQKYKVDKEKFEQMTLEVFKSTVELETSPIDS
jgi:c-di-GMP phosphodiesterase